MIDRVAAERRNMEIGAISTANRMMEYGQKAVKSSSYNGNLGLDNVTNQSNQEKRIGLFMMGNQVYIATYAEKSTSNNPIVKVGDYEISVNEVNPRNATQLEMFALTSYMEDAGIIKKQGMCSYSKMKAYASQAEYNGYCQGIMDEAKMVSQKRDWVGIMKNAKDTFMAIPQTYEQALECQSLIDSFNGWEKQGQYDVAEAFSQMKNELGQKIQSGDLEEKIQIGGNAYTNEEWDKVLEKYDKAHMEIKSEIEEEIEERVEEQISNEQLVELLKDREFDPFGLSSRGNGNVPYSHLAKDGIIAYNGAVFVCDEEKNALLLGDCSDMKNCIRVSLEDGGSLIVNRDNLGELSSAISMFSPEDIRRILCAIADDKKIQSTQKEIDDAENALAEIA